MKSLADILGIEDPTLPQPKAPLPTNEKLTAKQLTHEILNSTQYRESLRRRIIMDELPPAVECKLWDYAYGKPVEKVEIKDTTDPLESMSTTDLKERARFLMNLAEQLEDSEAEVPVPGVH